MWTRLQVLVATWKLGLDKTKLCSHRISRLDETVSKFSVSDSPDLSPFLFTPPTRTRQDQTVLSCPCRWCKLGITRFTITLLFSGWWKMISVMVRLEQWTLIRSRKFIYHNQNFNTLFWRFDLITRSTTAFLMRQLIAHQDSEELSTSFFWWRSRDEIETSK